MHTDTQILIVGAGPTGLLLALLLKQQGIAVRIIDKNLQPVKTSNALAIQIRTLEMFDDLNLLEDLLKQGYILHGMEIYQANQCIVDINFSSIKNTCYPFVLSLSQHDLEVYLIKQLQSYNVSIERGMTLTQITQHAEYTVAEVNDSQNQTNLISANWLIACDGAHSTVREQLNIGFPGAKLKQHFVLADIETNSHLVTNKVKAWLSQQGPLLFIRYSEKYVRIIADVTQDMALCEATQLSQPLLEKLLKERLPYTIPIKNIIWTSGFWIHERLIDVYKTQHIFFAGDAAHIHSPVGGQGMNTGLQDIYNLAWKLALVIKQQSPISILDTYESERRPIAKAMLKGTTFLTTIITVHNAFLIMLRNFLLKYLLKIKYIRKKMLMTFSELSIHYQPNTLIYVAESVGNAIKPGSRFIDVQIGTHHLLSHLRGNQFNLLIFIQDDSKVESLIILKKKIEGKVGTLIKCILITPQAIPGWNEEMIIDEKNSAHKIYQVKNPYYYLIRPDKYIGLCAELDNTQPLLDYINNNFIS